jgi:two-component system, OmpR family, sensor histidine kinase KdpD
MSRGALRIYLGAAPGVGKTYAMLDEGWRRAGRGADVVIAIVETHDRAATAERLRDLPVIARKAVEYRGTVVHEMDLAAVLVRHPQVALVDELAHTNAPGSRNEKRWQDIESLLDKGIDVITTVNIQHLESLNDVVTGITGIRQAETVPDYIVRNAEQVELVDMTPEALRRRMAHGNIYPPDRIDAALHNYFRQGNLTALRELALLWLADQVEENLDAYIATHDIANTWETRERVVVAISGIHGGESLIRRAARIASARRGALIGVRVVTSDGLADSTGDGLVAQRDLLAAVGGAYYEVVSDDIAEAIISFARTKKATQIVIGATSRSRWTEFVRGSLTQTLLRKAADIDVHVIGANHDAHRQSTTSRATVHPRHRSQRRHQTARLLTFVGLPVLTGLLTPLRDNVTLTTVTLVYLASVIGIASLGSFAQATVSAIGALLLINWYFTPPVHTFTISSAENIVSLIVFLAVALLVSALTDRVTRRSFESRRSQTEAEALARTSAVLVADSDDLDLLVEQISEALNLDGATLMQRTATGWTALATSGTSPPATPDDGTRIDLADAQATVLVLRRTGPAINRQVLQAFADQIETIIERQQLRIAAQQAAALTATDEMRTSLLRAVSHDLRTPLTSIKAAVSTMLQPDIQLDGEDTRTLLQSIESSTDRLNRVVANLLDLSRLETGAVDLRVIPTAVEDIASSALDYLELDPTSVALDVPESVPMVLCDPPLLERVLSNLIANAVTWNVRDVVRIDALGTGAVVQIRVVDHGPGIAHEERARAFQPFQRLGDHTNRAGVGLGLAVAHGLTTAMGGTIELDDTPGGGLTVTVTLPQAESGASSPPSAVSSSRAMIVQP